jgi:hypothetical protein
MLESWWGCKEEKERGVIFISPAPNSSRECAYVFNNSMPDEESCHSFIWNVGHRTCQGEQNISPLCSSFEKRRQKSGVDVREEEKDEKAVVIFAIGFKARGRIITRPHHRFWRDAIFPAPAKHMVVLEFFRKNAAKLVLIWGSTRISEESGGFYILVVHLIIGGRVVFDISQPVAKTKTCSVFKYVLETQQLPSASRTFVFCVVLFRESRQKMIVDIRKKREATTSGIYTAKATHDSF